jgi:hypothetical protein
MCLQGDPDNFVVALEDACLATKWIHVTLKASMATLVGSKVHSHGDYRHIHIYVKFIKYCCCHGPE